MSTTTEDLTSDDIPPPPFSEDELREQWNAQADVDEGNHWGNLGLDEQLAWAQTRAIEPLRPLLYQVARIAECIGHDAMSEIGAISDKAAAWLEENPSGAKGIDPRCCPPPGVEAPAVKVTEQATTIRYEFEVFDEHDQTVASGDAATLEEADREGRHYLARYQQDGPCTLELRRVDVLSVSDSQPAPSPADAPLWRVMHQASADAEAALYGFASSEWMIAAEIRALRDWLLPEDGPRPGISWPVERAAWDARQAIRAMLTTEADRAERRL